MKKKTLAPHDEVKLYLKTARKAIDDALFIRPEWRKPKSAKLVGLAISRLDETYYPFSDKKNKHMRAVWNEVLKEKRGEMLLELKEREQTNPEQRVKKTGSAAAENAAARAAGAPLSGRSVPECSQPAATWLKERVAKLRADVKATRSASKIARKLNISPSYVSLILKKGSLKDQLKWFPRFEAILSELQRDKNAAVDLPIHLDANNHTVPLEPVPQEIKINSGGISLTFSITGDIHEWAKFVARAFSEAIDGNVNGIASKLMEDIRPGIDPSRGK